MRLPGSYLVARALVICFAGFVCGQAGSQSPAKAGDEAAQGLIRLDLVVKDKSEKPVTGLDAKDFLSLDNGQPSKIVSFRAFNGVSAKPDPPAEVILVIDTLELPDRLASYEKHEVERFLHQDGGLLAHPVSLFWL